MDPERQNEAFPDPYTNMSSLLALLEAFPLPNMSIPNILEGQPITHITAGQVALMEYVVSLSQKSMHDASILEAAPPECLG